MAEARYLPLRDYSALKTASRQLLGLYGTGTAASRVTRLSQPDLSRRVSHAPQNAERFLPLDVIADLEAAAGEPLVTQALADLSNYLLIAIPEAPPGDRLAAAAGETVVAFGKMMVELGASVVDGAIADGEGRALLGDIKKVMLALAALAKTVEVQVEREEPREMRREQRSGKRGRR